MKELLKQPEYEFVQSDPHLGKNVILLTLSGSHSYGTNIAGSDIDVRGITVESSSDLIGLTHYEQYQDAKTDTVIYTLRKGAQLMMNCNPNVIEMLGAREDQYLVLNEAGRLLRDSADLFLSRKAKHTFGSYATAQLRRLQNALARDHYPQPQKEAHILGSVQKQMAGIEERYTDFGLGRFNLYIDKSEREGFETEIFMDIVLNHYPIRDFKNIYSEMHNVVSDYEKISHRNKKKTEGALCKHAMHLIRLLITGTDVLRGNGIITYREKEHDLLMDIRNGVYSFDEIFAMVDHYEEEFKYAADHSPLPEKPDFNKINDLVMEINRSYIK